MSKFNVSFSPGDFVHISQRSNSAEKVVSVQRDDEEVEIDENSDRESSKLFQCQVDGCIKQYQRYSSLEKHMLYGECKLVPERESLLDKARIIYRDKLLLGADTQPVLSTSTISSSSENGLAMGWALKKSKKAARFSEPQKNYLNGKFLIGQATGHKIDPATVARDMRYARDNNGLRLFTVTEFLTPQQVQSYFSRTATKLKSVPTEIPDIATDDAEHFTAAAEEEAYSVMREDVISQCQLVHPVIYDTFNLCYLNNIDGLKNLSIKMLCTICDHFDIDREDITSRRKAPYITLLSNMLKSCSCA
ncbi:hypothetical protein QZH41_001412 [Actinostola sp. cb2023]|nr:hypothetical protein QZH41_001412 [Actinostola sp. cb2023]